MRGVVGKVFVKTGARVSMGDDLLTLEAMKIETVVKAEIDSVIAEIIVSENDTVDTGDLLVVLSQNS